MAAGRTGGHSRGVGRSNAPLRERIPWKTAILVGLVAFAATFVLLAGVLEVDAALSDDEPGDVSDGSDSGETDDDPGRLTLYGWLFFAAHHVDLNVAATTILGEFSISLNIVEEAAETVPSVAFYAVPVAVLTAASAWFTSRAWSRGQSGSDSALTGAAVTAGYLPPVVASALLFDWQTDSSGSVATYEIPLVDGVLLAGLLIPLVCGALGGYLTYWRKN